MCTTNKVNDSSEVFGKHCAGNIASVDILKPACYSYARISEGTPPGTVGSVQDCQSPGGFESTISLKGGKKLQAG